MDDTVEKKVKQTAREATERVEASSSKATEGFRDCQAKILSATQANIDAMCMDIAIIGRNEANLRRTKDEIEAVGRACLVVRADLSTTEGAKRAREEPLNAAENWDVLVNNAGVVHAAPLADVTIEQWESTFAVDLRAVLVLTQMVVHRCSPGAAAKSLIFRP
jgi:short-subunit dehydrogenase